MDITQPLVTVYITNYNYETYLQKAIDSVLNQTFNDYELIIIDDGSTDDSRAIILQYNQHPKIRIIFQENKGLNRTNNIALKASRGKYIMRLDADDYLDPQALLVMVNVMEENQNIGLVFPDYYYVDQDGNIIGQERRHDFKESVSLLDQPAHGACTLIRKRCLLGIGGYNGSFRCQDGYDLWLRFIKKHEVQNVNLPLFFYRKHGKNLTSNNELILKTRAEIKRFHADKNNRLQLETIGILPVRGKCLDPGNLDLEILGQKRLIDWTIEAALGAVNVSTLIVTSPDERVLDHVNTFYKGKVTAHKRDEKIARENVPLARTIDNVLESCPIFVEPDSLMLLSTETPFRSSMFIDKAINTMRIFDVDTVIPVIPENDLFFVHDGHGLKIIGNDYVDSPMRFERDYIYRKIPGMSLIALDRYRVGKKILGKTIGHVILDDRSAMVIKNRTDLDLFNYYLTTVNQPAS